MNKSRRKRIEDLVATLREIIDEEQEAYDNLPESIQDSGRGDEMIETIEELAEAADTIDGVVMK